MIQEIFTNSELPLPDLERLGLSADGRLRISDHDLGALLSGARTSLLHLADIEDDDLKIADMDARLSLQRNSQGGLDLLIHPVYRRMMTPAYVNTAEAEKFLSGELTVMDKTIDLNGQRREVLIEFDQDTREFIVTASEQVIAPDLVNHETLTAGQQRQFKKGKEISMQDGTRLRYSATVPEGIRSNKRQLIASLITPEGTSYRLYEDLKAMSNKKEDQVSDDYSQGYYQVLEEMSLKQGRSR